MPTLFVHGRSGVFKIAPVTAGTTVTDISAWVDSVSYPRGLDIPEDTTFGQGARTYVSGLANNTFNIKGVWDGTGGAIDSILAGLVGAPVAVGLEFDPTGIDSVAHSPKFTYAGNTSGNQNPGVYLTNLTVDGGIADVIRFSATFMGNLGVVHGTN